jgi:hypothetical protein
MEDDHMVAQPAGSNDGVVQVYPHNPHYLMFQGKPTLLITSAEHYGALINPDFDIPAYLDVLARYDLNYTRVYPGAYIEVEGMFIENNTLAPKMGRHLLPWARSAEPGAWDGGPKYDLSAWSEEYFERLHIFIAEAARRDIIVELCFFNCQYAESWHACALNPANNIQAIGPADFNAVQTLESPALVEAQARYVEKIVREVNGYDNVILEICDEPTLKGTPAALAAAWIDHLAGVIAAVERGLPKQHVVAQQVMLGIDFTRDARIPLITTQYICQSSEQIGGVEALDTLYALNKPIECNETAYYPIWYEGDVESASRAEAWEFMVGGGAAFNHLNGRFTVTDPRGATPDNHRVLRALKCLRTFLEGVSFAEMVKDTSFFTAGLEPGAHARGMSLAGSQYVLYIHHSTLKESGVNYVANWGDYEETLELHLPPGRYVAKWYHPEDLELVESREITLGEKPVLLRTPRYAFDIALKIYLHS